MLYLYEKFVEWIKENPHQAVFAIIVFYVVSILIMAPITYVHVMLGFTYSQVAGSSLEGWLLATPIASFSSLLGGSLTFLISKYML